MINAKPRNNLTFPGMNPWEMSLSKKKIELLKKSWAGIFREHFLSNLPVGPVSKHFNQKIGRPTKELFTTCGACVLQQIFDLTDSELRAQLAFNQQWHYALDTADQDDHVISLKTFWTTRQILVYDELANKTFNKITDELIKKFNVSTDLQRLDSVHINSNMACLGRVRLLSRVCTIFLKNLKRHFPELYDSLSDTIRTRYQKDEDPDYFGNTKPTAAPKRLLDIALDINELLELFKGNPDVCAKYTYKNMQRTFSEHCSIENENVVVKAAKEIPADSLQNPSDPDASYDGHKGQGYQVQIMETHSNKPLENPAEGEQTGDANAPESLELITHVSVEPAHCHDSKAIEPALDDVKERSILPKELEADTLYGGHKNKKKAAEQDVELVAPTPGKKPKLNKDDFQFDPETKKVNRCPQGHAPINIKMNKKGSITGIWAKETCAQCPIQAECAVKKGKKAYRLCYHPKEVKSILARQHEQSEEFREKYRRRSGVEASISRYIHMTGARRLKYRGLKRVSFAAQIKALGINMFRATKIWALQPENACIA